MLVVAIGWQLYSLTGSALDLGLLGLAQFVPMLVLTLLVGHVADRYDHRVILMLCQPPRRSPPRSWSPARQWAGSIRPSSTSPSPWSAPRAPSRFRPWRRSSRPGAAHRGAAGDGLVRLRQPDRPDRRPGAGRLLYCSARRRSTASPSGYGASARAFCRLMRFERAPRSTEPFSLARCSAASASCGTTASSSAPSSLDMFAVLLGGATALLPIFARDILKTGPWGLGLLRARPAVGALAMSLLLARRPLTLPIGPVLFARDLRSSASPRSCSRCPPICCCRWRRWR